jgi:hypothetical protein
VYGAVCVGRGQGLQTASRGGKPVSSPGPDCGQARDRCRDARRIRRGTAGPPARGRVRPCFPRHKSPLTGIAGFCGKVLVPPANQSLDREGEVAMLRVILLGLTLVLIAPVVGIAQGTMMQRDQAPMSMSERWSAAEEALPGVSARAVDPECFDACFKRCCAFGCNQPCLARCLIPCTDSDRSLMERTPGGTLLREQ